MSKKSILLLTFIIIIIPAAILVVGFILGQLTPEGGVVEQSRDNTESGQEKTNETDSEENNTQEEKEAEQQRLHKYKYASIQRDKSIVLIDEDQNKLIATLQNNNWRELRKSPSGKYIAVLGQNTNEEPTNIFTYNIPEKKLEQITNFGTGQSGADSYTWIDNETLGFVQGSNPDAWFHTITVEGKSTIKQFRTDGEILSANAEMQIVSIREKTGELGAYSFDGTALLDPESMRELVGESLYEAGEKLHYIDNQTFLFTTTASSRESVFIINISNNSVQNISDGYFFEPVCIVEDRIFGFTENDTITTAIELRLDGEGTQIGTFNSETDTDLFADFGNCNSIGEFVVRAEEGNPRVTKYFEVTSGVEELNTDFFENALEAVRY